MKEERIWPRPQLNPLPLTASGLENPRVSLNGGGWKLQPTPPADFFDPATDISGWEDTDVPRQVEGGPAEYAYARTLDIPAQWEGCRVFLRFDGANCLARVFVDGTLAGEHYGGFVSWDCEITPYVQAGASHRLAVGITDKPLEVNPFHRGGLIRDVSLYALPQTYLSRLHARTVFDSTYTDATLTVSASLMGGAGSVALGLISPAGQEIPLPTLTGEPGEDLEVSVPIPRPLKWDSEHPHLYTLTASVLSDGRCVETAARQIGFRQIERHGNQVTINGDLLKLHGVNRHDIHPITGRAITHELAEEDVRLFKEANVNFIRTSHYPPRPDFLDLCDKYGIYVEDEIAVAFLGQGNWYTQSDPEYTPCFMGQFSEMLERDLSHPSVIIWSLANESYWGDNLAMMNAYAHQEDPTRLTIFSYPITQMEDDDRADIWSMHYAAWGQDPIALVDSFDRSRHEPIPWPVLHDESTHIPCYDRHDQRRDPGVRDFWGETIRQFWDILYDADGALGCAIWAGIDDVWLGSHFRFFGAQWGIFDGWRRVKPEYWHVRKAYSPIRLTGEPYAQGGYTAIAIRNRFNHTRLSEIRVDWKLGEASGTFYGPDLPPRASGELVIPAAFAPGAVLELAFTDAFGHQVEEGRYTLDEARPQLPRLTGGVPRLEQDASSVTVRGEGFSVSFSRETGLITAGYAGGRLVLTGGPALHLTGLALGPWQLEAMDARIDQGCACITLDGCYDRVKVRFLLRIDAAGLMETTYTLTDMPYPSPRKLAMRIGDDTDSGGYEEVGVSFTVPKELDTLSWQRKGPWTVYPDWHIARLEGRAPKFNPQGVNPLDRHPGWGWQLDEEDKILFGKYDIGRRGTRDFASLKSSILCAALASEDAAFTALSDGSDAVRMEVSWEKGHVISDRSPAVTYTGTWLPRDTKFRSLDGTETWSKTAGDTCRVNFTGTGIAWISSMDLICGTAKVYVDGALQDTIALGVRPLSPGAARGYEKDYRRLVFSVQNLPMGEHSLCIEVTGEKAPNSINSYVNIDHFIVLDGQETGDTRFIIDSEFNYPELSWGCYTKPPITVSTGYTRRVYTKLGR